MAAPLAVFMFGLIAGILGDTEVLAAQARGDGLAVVLAADVVVLGTQVVVHLGEVSLLVGGVGIAE